VVVVRPGARWAPHHNHQKKECAWVYNPRAPDFATVMHYGNY